MIGFARVGKVESPYEELRTTKRALWLARAERAKYEAELNGMDYFFGDFNQVPKVGMGGKKVP